MVWNGQFAYNADVQCPILCYGYYYTDIYMPGIDIYYQIMFVL